ncbi:restriction endonuclease subunit S [Vibrio parahaemolyticus]|uniref:restriction endonuclease subunit S n=1 Tax=Vibrio parahaemolyticus TaxID=670 RepID=UPI00186ABA5A|nr:restriction endonuclease subunit S [Vibrio parahaemolyticus]MBE3688484.1 restriction endonuclease subunit S [Vibrio parahaemolyticus]MBE3804278.1 restriction endonuclease subunit S [Vibrio parahaemolyticus]WCY99930.1 restriction endonuclease subunit S [Vibrio parahaemolyticus]WPD15136.1 restriction endonuclease subunit S [Vibrio parahaemolyticus]
MTKWKSQQLSNLASITMGSSPKSTAYNDEGIGLPLIQGNADIKNRLTKPRTYTSQITKECAPGSIIMTVRAPVGAIAKSTVKGCIGRGVCAISATKISQDYLYQYLISQESKWKKLEQGSTFSAIGSKDVKQLSIAYPESVKEQAQIAEVLSTVDKKIDLIDQKIAETEKLKTGLMQKLFSEGVGVQDENGNWQPHTEFRTTSIGQVPKTWQDAQIGDYVSELVSGVSVNSYDIQKTENEIGVLKTSAVIGGNFYPEFHKTVKPEDIARAKTTLKENTLVISRMNTPSLVGEFGYVSKDYNDLYLPDRLWMTVPTSKPHDVKALSYLMQYYPVKKSIKELATGTSNSMKNISKGKFLAVYVPHIPYGEQMMIREILSTVDIKLELLNKQKAETQQLKKGLMQKLLTGEWRVPVEDTEAA